MILLKYRIELAVIPLFIIFPIVVFAQAPPAQAVNPAVKKALPANNTAKDIKSKPSENQPSKPVPTVGEVKPEQSASMSSSAPANMNQMGKPASDLKMKTGMSTMTKKLEDPTRISDSFQSALKRLGSQTVDGAVTTTPTAITVLPDIELAAIIDGYGKERTALIKLGEKTHMVREGYTFTEIKGNVVLEIYVEKIELCEIKLNVSPPNQLLILR